MNPEISSNPEPRDTTESTPPLETMLDANAPAETTDDEIWFVGLDAEESADAVVMSEDPEPTSESDESDEISTMVADASSSEQDEQQNLETTPAQEEEPELFVDQWLDESPGKVIVPDKSLVDSGSDAQEVAKLQQTKVQLQQEITDLVNQKEQLIAQQTQDMQISLGRMIEEGTKELRERKTALRVEIEKLERRQARINQEMRSNFAGSSKELAIRVQGFKEYLVGSLQDLATAAEKLELSRTEAPPTRRRERVRDDREEFSRGARTKRSDRGDIRDRGERGNRSARRRRDERGRNPGEQQRSSTQLGESTFAEQSRRIRQLLDQYCNKPDYYGSPWQLRRTFEKQQAQKVQEWFFGQGGRGTIESTGSRLQNILVASAAISILHNIYSDRSRVLVLTDSPENLGEWRRGLQDCLGISRNNFGANRGVTLFDSPSALVQRAERLITDKLLPIIIIDETEELLNLSVLKFPIWLAFASNKRTASSNYLY